MSLLDRKRLPSHIHSGVAQQQPLLLASDLQGSPRRALTPSSPRRPLTPSSLQLFSSTTPLEISRVQFQCQESCHDNHTEQFSVQGCDIVLRRGNTLVLRVTTSMEISSSYCVSLTFVPVFRPRDRFGQFRARGVSKESKDLWLSIKLPPNFPVGKYHAHVSLSLKGQVEALTHFHHKTVAVLFNPWNKDDDSFLADPRARHDHLISEVGTIWRGTSRQATPTKWEFGQYEEHCLDAALFLLRGLDASQCRSAARVSREIVSLVNSRDNTGVLAGCFSGSYTGGTHPCRWNGSPAIIQRFFRSKTPVRYAQCWVFAGVAVTLLRALGIPSRPVTCYEAAHYCSRPQQVERAFSTEGELLHDATADQVWVYHVWCEAWMRRDDLPGGYDGWQALDPTPQDRQSGPHCVGPASVRAIREGRSGKEWPYGAEHLISEVSSDVRYLRVQPSFTNTSHRSLTVALVGHNEVGVRILTSGGCGTTPDDVTAKYRREVAEEMPPRSAGSKLSSHFPPPSRDCSFEVVTSDEASLGDDITLSVRISNAGPMLRSVDGRVVGCSVHYTGRPLRSFLSLQFSGTVSPGQSASVSLPIEARKCLRVLGEQGMLQFFVAVKVRESRQLFLKVHHFHVCPPPLLVVCPPTVSEGDMVRIKLQFRNILPSSLSRVLFMVQAQGLCQQRELSHKRLVLPGGVAMVECPIRAHRAGHYTILASMHCNQLTDVRGSAELEVTKTTEPDRTPSL